MQLHVDLTSLPVGVSVILAVLAFAELALDAVALVSLARRSRSTVALGSRWAWLAIIVLINPIGAILYLAIGRIRVPAPEEAPPVADDRISMTSVADVLYGDRNPQDGR